jgi:hypothetical protein
MRGAVLLRHTSGAGALPASSFTEWFSPARLTRLAGPAIYCPPRHPKRFEPWFMELTGILQCSRPTCAWPWRAAGSRRAEFRAALPFPHAVFDHFLDPAGGFFQTSAPPT